MMVKATQEDSIQALLEVAEQASRFHITVHTAGRGMLLKSLGGQNMEAMTGLDLTVFAQKLITWSPWPISYHGTWNWYVPDIVQNKEGEGLHPGSKNI